MKEIRETEGDDRTVIYIDDTAFAAAAPILLGTPGCHRPNGFMKIGINPLVQQSVDTAPFGMGLPPDSSEAGRVRNRALQEQANLASAPIQKLWTDALRSTGVPVDERKSRRQFFDELSRCCDLFLQMSIPEVEYPRSDPPEGLRFIGALPSVGSKVGKDVTFPEWWDEVVHAPEDEKRPIVVVTQGSAHNDPSELILPAIEGLKDLDITVVVILVKSSTIEDYPDIDIPANVKLAQFIPLDILFQHAAILVSQRRLWHRAAGSLPRCPHGPRRNGR